MENKDFIYTGLFIERDNLPKAKLEKNIALTHITNAFKPKEIDENLFGQNALIRVIGYGNDGVNEGLLVEINYATTELKNAFKSVEVPHITLSVSADGKPVDTKNLKFRKLKKPYTVFGVFGGYTYNGEVITDLGEE